jgi:hypothetical protein
LIPFRIAKKDFITFLLNFLLTFQSPSKRNIFSIPSFPNVLIDVVLVSPHEIICPNVSSFFSDPVLNRNFGAQRFVPDNPHPAIHARQSARGNLHVAIHFWQSATGDPCPAIRTLKSVPCYLFLAIRHWQSAPGDPCLAICYWQSAPSHPLPAIPAW